MISIRTNSILTTVLTGAVVGMCAVAFIILTPTARRAEEFATIEIVQGEGLTAIAKALRGQGLIRSEPFFVLYVQGIGVERSLKAGTYHIPYGLTIPQVASMIARGLSEPTDIEVVIPEGWNIWEIDKRLASVGLIKEGQLARTYPHKEGHLFPDTYRFAPGTTLDEIVRIMEANYMDKAAVRSDITLITASMLEKEAKSPEDMALVAGVIQKRMEKGMLLQIDATVGYGWCTKRFTITGKDCDVTQAPIASEIKIDGPYNTYMRSDLPVAAISNPGINALKAAANPTPSDYLYYLSNKDGSQIIYSKTHEEHLRNRQRYLGF